MTYIGNQIYFKKRATIIKLLSRLMFIRFRVDQLKILYAKTLRFDKLLTSGLKELIETFQAVNE